MESLSLCREARWQVLVQIGIQTLKHKSSGVWDTLTVGMELLVEPCRSGITITGTNLLEALALTL
jgi:hypothetical protein